jgi:glycerophosphoryl diester phosphodiesterase
MKMIWSTLGLLLLGACSAPAPIPSASFSRKRPALVAHRGGAALAPENTLAAFRKGLALGVDYLEMDVHMSKDGIPVVIHDPTIDRTTDGSGRVSDYTVAQLQAFNAAAKFPGGATERQVIPTFAQVLDLARDTPVRLEVEVKTDTNGRRYPGIEQKLLDELAARSMLDRVKILAFEFDTLKQVKALNPRVLCIALISVEYYRAHGAIPPAAVIDDVMTYGADGIGVDKNLLSAALTEEAHRRNLLVGVWTADAEADMLKFAEMRVDSITSNRPDALQRAVGGRRKAERGE